MPVVIGVLIARMLEVRPFRLDAAMGIVKTNQARTVGGMQRQSVLLNAMRPLSRYGHTGDFYLDPITIVVLNFDVSVQAKQVVQTCVLRSL